MSEKAEWETMWGAKVKTPTDMPDDILKDAITTSIQVLSELDSSAEQEDYDKQSAAIQKIKEHMDENWSPCWHVVCGRSFGSLVTHEANRFIYFYVEDKAVMIYKA